MNRRSLPPLPQFPEFTPRASRDGRDSVRIAPSVSAPACRSGSWGRDGRAVNSIIPDLASESTFDGDEAETTPGRPSARHGVEVSADYRAFDWLAFNGSFAFTHARYTDHDYGAADTEPGHPGNYIPGAAKIIASGSGRLADFDPWSAELRFRFFGRWPLIEDNSVTSQPTAVFDAQIGYKITEQMRLRLDTFNLLNSKAHDIDYFYPSQLANESAPFYDVHYHPIEPLSARVTLSFTF